MANFTVRQPRARTEKMHYRHDLSAAHQRIHQLEEELATERMSGIVEQRRADAEAEAEVIVGDPIRIISEPLTDTSVSSSTTSGESSNLRRLMAWSAWPVPALVVLIAVYVGMHGVHAPSSLLDIESFTVGSSASLAFGIAAAALFIVRYLMNLANDGDSSFGQRLMLVFAIAVALPFVIPSLVFALPAIGMLVSVVSLGGALIGGIHALVQWLRG